ncbi:MAG: hypothetical protein ABIS59_03920 [Candidatus Saccharibacteria bacterium]
MAKFMIVYRSEIDAEGKMAQSTPEEMQASMQEWMVWKEEADKVMNFDWGSPIQARHHFGAAVSAIDVTGYSLFESEDKEACHALLEKHPHLKQDGNSIDILEYLPMPGM